MNNFIRFIKKHCIQFAILIVCFACFSACSKDESTNTIPPIIEFKTGGLYTSADTAIAEGSKIYIGIKASANGGENLCNLIVRSNNTQSLMDYGFNAASIDKDLIIYKNADSIQKITIIIRNKNGISNNMEIIIRKNGSAYKPILSFNITLGGQNNSTIGSFASLNNGLTYFLSDATQNQAMIDLLYYYTISNSEYNTIASAGANIIGIFSGTNAPEYWLTKNTTYFSRSVINIPNSSFDNAINDSIIIANIFTNGGRKAKALAANQIWGIQTQAGKFGFLKIISINGQENGTVEFAVKLQQ
ncbi:MAG: hypothetical protein HXX18_07605 [Bacteroidetes bacterium]|nr:hypothetical protein [Bacteroidota bacterium]